MPSIPARKLVGWYNLNGTHTMSRYHAPEIVSKKVFIPWDSIQAYQELSIEKC